MLIASRCWALAPKPFDEGELIGTIIAASKFSGNDRPEEDARIVKDAGFDNYSVRLQSNKASVVIDKGSVSEVVEVEKDEAGNLKKVSYYFRHREKIIARSRAYYESNKEKIKERNKVRSKEFYDRKDYVKKQRAIRDRKKEVLEMVSIIVERVDFDLPYLKKEPIGRPKKLPERQMQREAVVETNIADANDAPDSEVESNELFERIRVEIESMELPEQEIANRIIEGVTDTKMILALGVTREMIESVRDLLKNAAGDWSDSK